MRQRSIGELRTYFALQERSSTADTLGERSNTYTEVFKFWGGLRNGRQALRTDGGSLRSEDTLLLRTHWRAGFKNGGQQRVVDQVSGRTYRVDNVLDTDHRKQWLDVVVVELPVAGT